MDYIISLMCHVLERMCEWMYILTSLDFTPANHSQVILSPMVLAQDKGVLCLTKF